MVDIRQPIYITDTIDAINVPEVATVAVTKAAPDVALEAAVPEVSAATSQDSGTNKDTSKATYPIVTPVLVVHDTKWYKEYFVLSIDINGAIPDRDFGIRTPVGEVITRNSDNSNKYSQFNYLLFMFPPEEIKLIVSLTNFRL